MPKKNRKAVAPVIARLSRREAVVLLTLVECAAVPGSPCPDPVKVIEWARTVAPAAEVSVSELLMRLYLFAEGDAP